MFKLMVSPITSSLVFPLNLRIHSLGVSTCLTSLRNRLISNRIFCRIPFHCSCSHQFSRKCSHSNCSWQWLYLPAISSKSVRGERNRHGTDKMAKCPSERTARRTEDWQGENI